MAESEFAQVLRGLLAEQGLSMRALARQVPVNAGQLSRVLHDLRRPSAELAVRCDTILGTGDLLERAASRWRPRDADSPSDLRAVSGDPVSAALILTADPAGDTARPTPAGAVFPDSHAEPLTEFAAVARATWPGTHVIGTLPDAVAGGGAFPAIVGFPGGTSFAGGAVRATLRIASDGADGAVILGPGPGRHASTHRRPGLLIASRRSVDSTAFFAMDVRALPHSTPTEPFDLAVPFAYRLDDLTYAVLWAMANLDQELLDDDATLDAARHRTRIGAWAGRREISRQEVGDLTAVSQMWLGSDVCARHITGNLARLADVPVFWTREQRGEEASTWLLFAHKLDYLKATTAPFGGTGSHPTRVFCIPEEAVTASPTTERLLVLLAAALMEAHGVIVHVTADPAYAQVPGFVWTASGPALIATWVRADQVWHTDTTARRDITRDCQDAAGDAAADSVIAAPSSAQRLERLAHYLGVDWRWLLRRVGEIAPVGWAGLVQPRSRLLSAAGLDLATRYLAARDQVARV